MNATLIVIFVLVAVMGGLMIYGRVTAKRSAAGSPKETPFQNGTPPPTKELFESVIKKSKKIQAADEIPPTEQVINVDQIVGRFVLTKQGDLVAIFLLKPIDVSASVNPLDSSSNFARIIYQMKPHLTLQFFQLPVPNRITELIDKYARLAHEWGIKASKADEEGGQSKYDKFMSRRTIARLIGIDLIRYGGGSPKRATYIALTQNATQMGALSESSLDKGYKELENKAIEVFKLFQQEGLNLELLSPDGLLEVLWYAYNPSEGGDIVREQTSARFLNYADRGIEPEGEDRIIPMAKVEDAILNPDKIPNMLAPASIEEEVDYLRFSSHRMLFYYIDGYNRNLPIINNLMGHDRSFANNLWVSFYVTAPDPNVVAHQIKKQSTGVQAMAEVKGRMGQMGSYRDQKEIMEIEQARAGAETGENVPRYLGLYLAFTVVDDDKIMKERKTAFESALTSEGLRFIPIKYTTREAWQTMIPLGQKIDTYEDIPAFAYEMAPLVPVTSEAWIEPGGDLVGYTTLSHGALSPVAIRRQRGEDKVPGDAFVGRTGSGKSAALKFMMMNWLSQGHKVIVIDPKMEFSEIVRYLGGSLIEIGGGRGFNLFNFPEMKSIDMSAKLNKDFSDLVFQDNHTALRIMYGNLKNFTVSGEEDSLLVKALQLAMKVKGMDSKDPSTWGKEDIFLKDVFDQLHLNLRDANPLTVQTMLTTLEQYATEEGQYYEMFNTPTNFDMSNELIGMTFGLAQFSQEKKIKNMIYQYALRIAFQSSVRSFILDKETVPIHVIIDEASQTLLNKSLTSTVVNIMTMLGAYNVSVHLAFQDMAAIYKADEGQSENQASINSLVGSIPAYLLFKQEPSSAEAAARLIGMGHGETQYITGINEPGRCLLAFTGDPVRVPLKFIIHENLLAMIDTRAEQNKERIDAYYAEEITLEKASND